MYANIKAYYLLIGFFFFTFLPASAQNQKLADSLVLIYQKNTLQGTAKLELLRKLAFNEVKDLNLSLQYAEELIRLSRQTGNDSLLHSGYLQKGNKKRLLGNLDEALEAYIKSAEVAKKINYTSGQGTAYMSMADLYSVLDNHTNSMKYYDNAIAILRKSDNQILLGSAILNAGDEFLSHKNYPAALRYFNESGEIFDKAKYHIGKAYNLGNIGMVYANTGKNTLAEKNINEAIRILDDLKDFYPISVYLLSMSDIYLEKGDMPTALRYAMRSQKLAQEYGLKRQISDANLKLSELYEKSGNLGKSLSYYKRHITYRDSVNNVKAVQKMADLRTDYEISQKQIEVDLLNQEKSNQRIILGLLAVLLGLIAYAYAQKQKANTLLQRQKEEINQKSRQLEQSLTELRATQTQLIQKEKMASLGELTAGIAHEIQNPLNFVNNFSEVSAELVAELEEEQQKPDRDTEMEAELLVDLKQNLQKITHHGSRASAIVRGMLEHSRSATGEKRPTNLNALADEYLKIAYQGLRAKDKTDSAGVRTSDRFNAELVTNFLADIVPVEMVPQEIGRVLLNLYNNAFYAVNEKQKTAMNGYLPTVTVSTSQLNGHTEIRVSDNGTGIPESVKGKIFQPFFTTKPTGEGTGLGLSLSYDIITKGHGGSLSVESQDGEGTTFVIQLPSIISR